MTTVSDDPSVLYQDVLIGLATGQGVNNGQPSLHALCLAACAPSDGESIVHIGAGTGYYTAILAALVGDSGRVVAYEVDASLANQARENLKDLTHVSVVAASAVDADLPEADIVYVNAGVTHPVASWLDALNVDGRLILPLTPNEGFGCMLLVTRRAPTSYAATLISRVKFIPCIGARDDDSSKALSAALEPSNSMSTVKSLRRGTQPDSTAWCIGKGWWLSTTEAA